MNSDVGRRDVQVAYQLPDGPRTKRAPGAHRSAAFARFTSFSLIGGAIFVGGLALQVLLTGWLHVGSLWSYVVQAVVSVEASFLLNRWLTWRKTAVAFWPSFARFNLQKVITVTANLLLYAGLLALGLNYLLANVLLTVAFTVVNYLGADRFVFRRAGRNLAVEITGPIPILAALVPPARVEQPEAFSAAAPWPAYPLVSVVVPVRGNEKTIRAAVDAILGQDYPGLSELLLVGSPGDSTWAALDGIDDPRLLAIETETPPGIRDANFKRDLGIRRTSGDLVTLIDSDMVIPPDWMSNAVRLLTEHRVDCVAGVMRSIRDDFWGRFVDQNRLSAKTPRVRGAYLVTASHFGAADHKPPITANTLFTREMYEKCPIDPVWSHGSLEDYEWFWRVSEAGHQALVSDELYGWHHHRAGFASLIGEYRRSARGCAYFIRAHGDAPFARKRLAQAITIPLALLAFIVSLTGAAMAGHGRAADLAAAALVLGGTVALAAREFVSTRTLESLLYPLPALVLGTNYTVSLITHLVRSTPMQAVTVPRVPDDVVAGVKRRGRWLPRLRHPLTAILAVQAVGSLSLIGSNTAFGDEANYLWLGHLILNHWLHGASWPASYGQHVLSGSPMIYPPIGALADAVGGLAGARTLALLFMLAATALLYSVASSLFNRTVAACASMLWTCSEPAMKLAFATYDPLTVMLDAIAAWLIVQAPKKKHRAELVLLGGLVLGLSNATTYSGVVIDPVVLAFAFLVWRPAIGNRLALIFTGWFAAATAAAFAFVMTAGGSWPGIMTTVFARNFPDRQGLLLVGGDVWAFSGLVMVIATAGAVLALGARVRSQALLVTMLGLAAFVVPLAQLHEQTGWSLDKHIAFGLWFACMAGGYAAAAALHTIGTRYKRAAAIGAAVVMLVYPGYTAWYSAWLSYHGWANSTSFTTALSPLVAKTPGYFYMAGGIHLAEYYTPQGSEWERWSDAVLPQLTASGIPQSTWDKDLRKGDYGVVALFYPTSFSAPTISGGMLLQTSGSGTSGSLLKLAGDTASQPGLPTATLALESDPAYKLAAVGPYDSRSSYGVYAIWKRVSPGKPAKVRDLKRHSAKLKAAKPEVVPR